MDRSERSINLVSEHLADARKLLQKDGRLSDSEMARRSWQVCLIDDKSIFGEDARRLARAFRTQGSDSFYVVRVSDLLAPTESVPAYRFDASEYGVEEFQGRAHFDINLSDCLLLNLPITCAVLRPGNVDVTTFAGGVEFIKKIES